MKIKNLKVYALAALVTLSSLSLTACTENKTVVFDGIEFEREMQVDYSKIAYDIIKISDNIEALKEKEAEMNSKKVYLHKQTSIMRKSEYNFREATNLKVPTGFEPEVVDKGNDILEISSWYPTDKQTEFPTKEANYYYRGCNVDENGNVTYGQFKASIDEIEEEYLDLNSFSTVLSAEQFVAISNNSKLK